MLKTILLCAKIVLVFGACFLCGDFEARHDAFFFMGLGFRVLKADSISNVFSPCFFAPKLRCLGLDFFVLILVWISQSKSFIHC